MPRIFIDHVNDKVSCLIHPNHESLPKNSDKRQQSSVSATCDCATITIKTRIFVISLLLQSFECLCHLDDHGWFDVEGTDSIDSFPILENRNACPRMICSMN